MAYTIDAALSEHYEQYEWTLYNSDYDTLEWSENCLLYTSDAADE